MNIFLRFITQPDVQVFVYLTVVQDLGQSVIVTSQIMMLMMVLELFLQVRGWTAWSCFLLSCLIFFFILFACFLFLFSLFHYSIEDAGFAECIVEKKKFSWLFHGSFPSKKWWIKKFYSSFTDISFTYHSSYMNHWMVQTVKLFTA